MNAFDRRGVNGDAGTTTATAPSTGTPVGLPVGVPAPAGAPAPETTPVTVPATANPGTTSAGTTPSAGAPAPRRPTRPRTAVRRLPDKQVLDRGGLDALLDAALVAHVAVMEVGEPGRPPRPLVIPVAFARDHEQLLVHGSTASRAFRILATGQPTCVTVTVVDGLMIARSQFESSMRYRCGMVFGSFEVLHGRDKRAALNLLAAKLLPGLEGARPPSEQELAATAVLAMPLEEWSLKVSAGHPEDADDDLDRPVWAGTIPLHHVWGAPQPAPGLSPQLAVPPAIAAWPQGRA